MLRNTEDKLDLWLMGGAERFRRDRAVQRAAVGGESQRFTALPSAAGGGAEDAGAASTGCSMLLRPSADMRVAQIVEAAGWTRLRRDANSLN